MIYSFQQIVPSETDWNAIELSYDSTCFHCKKWMRGIHRLGMRPFYLTIWAEGTHVGYFIGERIWFGFRLITSPIEGSGYTQGLAMLQYTSPEDRIAIYQDLSKWLFSHHIASFFQVDDWQLRTDSCAWDEDKANRNALLDAVGVKYQIRRTLHLKINRPLEELWSGLHYSSAKYCINKAKKLGLTVRIIDRFEDINTFIEIHYSQIREVLARKGARPLKGQRKNRLKILCETMFPDRVLMIEVLGDDKEEHKVMATAIFFYDKGECIYWTGASFQCYLKYSPNELMVWEAIKVLHEKGGGDLNFGGSQKYKLKFGTLYAYVPRIYFTKYDILLSAKLKVSILYRKSRGWRFHKK